jgi:hypothetical protein
MLCGVSFLNFITLLTLRNSVSHFFPADVSCSCYSTLCSIEVIHCCLALEVENILFGDIVHYMLCDFGCCFPQIFQVHTIPGFV